MSVGIQQIGICPPIPGHPNCQPGVVLTINQELIDAVLRIKREAEVQHCRKEMKRV